MIMAILFKAQNDLTYTLVDMKTYFYYLIAETISSSGISYFHSSNTLAHPKQRLK